MIHLKRLVVGVGFVGVAIVLTATVLKIGAWIFSSAVGLVTTVAVVALLCCYHIGRVFLD